RQGVDAVIAVADERVGMVGTGQDRRQREARVQLHRHVLERVHGAVGFAALHRHFQLLEEQTLAADGGQRAVQDLVAAGAHRHQLDLEPGMRCPQPGGDVFGLPEGERAFAGGDAEYWHPPIIPYTRRSCVRSWGRQRRLTSSGCSPWRSTAWTWPSPSRRSSINSWRATRQLRWMRTKRSPNSSSSDFSDSSIRSRPRAWYTTTYFSSACR